MLFFINLFENFVLKMYEPSINETEVFYEYFLLSLNRYNLFKKLNYFVPGIFWPSIRFLAFLLLNFSIIPYLSE